MERRVAELTRKSHTVGSVLGKMGELASFVVGSLSFQGENSTDQSEGLHEASLMTGTPPQPTTPPVKLSNLNPDPNATARGEDHNRIAGVAYISDLASAIPVAKTQFSPQIQTMELNHEQSGMKPKQYNQRGHRLPSDAVNPLVDTGITSHDNLSEVPTFNKKVSQVGDPLQHATLDKAPQDPHLDQEGDVIM
ncbi:hypothetical protein L914_21780 [Phytophthora nicotianae]|uniref:Uncharacterized protein n=2 Tax=Phytophthora nicotianae TaxID=4792 RepID=V9DTD9_PHYNI|nr:hypothetical protein F443_22711 [Phytophthora nicotianae P1569]ETM30543.1 hypothetical protein L914_21780 [Phytophthora nicotianae]